MNLYLSFIIPAFNEEARIQQSLEKALEYFAAQSYTTEIIVVDDGSSDNTVACAKAFAGIEVWPLPHNMGKGAAVRHGMLRARGQYRIFSDADFSTPVYETAKILTHLEKGADICIGNRALDMSYIKKHQPWYREIGGMTFNRLVRMLLIDDIKDTQCGFKGFTAKAAEAVFSQTKIDRFGFDVEALYLAEKMNMGIAQVPVEWYNDERSKFNPLTDGFRTIAELLRIKRLHQ